MQFLPSGLVVPPLPYLVALAVALVGVVVALRRLRPPVTQQTVLAAAPWMVLGGALHGVEQFGLVPAALVPFLAAPAVYVTTTVLAGAVWAVGAARAAPDDTGQSMQTLAWVGGGAVLLVTLGAYAHAFGRVDPLALTWPAVAVVGALVVAAPVYKLLWTYRTTAAKQAGAAGAVALFAHALDGVSTTIGVDLLGTGERSPVPRAIMEFAGTLPTAPYLGTGWLFVVAKLVVAAGIVVLLADYVEEDPVEGNLLLVLVSAVGLGPAANNLVLFLLTGSV